ncbi:hypothetical protein [Streptomyces griseorubiginosus]|uniref:Integral membrane protein n=1 Tax=Streptomyces griseorubiginosus TaxID=67304 RepID=A0A117R1Q3_9ACTN|nr:hypothetical protein [Streptomyces griseorubiginosus]KUN66225.1 hypothetical protein AQJ54_17830 [Streptomyces griseorubiginosus]
MRASPAVRSLRAAVFAALCVLLAAGGHTLATGMTPPVWAQAVGFLPVFVAGWLLGGRERSLGAIGAATLTSQAGLHLAFGAAGSHSRATRQGMAMPHMAMPHTVKVHMAMHGMRMIHTTPPPPHAVTPHATAAHLSAALLLTWWLRRGEAALWSLLRRSVALVPGLAAWWQGYGEPAAPDPASPAPDHGTRTPRPLLLRHTVHRRGPPKTIPYAI